MGRDRQQFPFHPLLFASFPVLSLLATNLGEVRIEAGLRIWLGSLVLAVVSMLVSWLLLRRWQSAALVASAFILLVLGYGHLYSSLSSLQLAGLVIGRHKVLIPLSFLFMLGCVIVAYRRSSFPVLTGFLNTAAIVLVILPAAQMLIFYVNIAATPDVDVGMPEPDGGSQVQALPDIYYIILDEYPRADVLAESYAFDNEPFLHSLEEMGFFIAGESQSNYAQTELSLASSLNFNYISTLVPDLDVDSDDRAVLWPLIKQNAVMAFLDQIGYTTVAFETGYSWSQIETADLYLGPSQGVRNTATLGLSDFEVLFLRKTALLILYDARLVLPEILTPALERPARRSYDRTEFVLQELERIARQENPHFVFAHLLVPHPPYVYGDDGEYVGNLYGLEGPLGDEDALYTHNVPGHRRSVAYINERMLELVSILLASSDPPPIIILQADHGVPFSTHEDRMAIFNAYFLPGEGADALYPDITPVNTFRVVFNSYFGADLPLLDDRSLFSGYEYPYDFEEVD